jgi:hypothetical protein
MTFLFRVGRLSSQEICIIGLERKIGIPLVTYEMLINVYLTMLFLLPLRNLARFEDRFGSANERLQRMTKRCVIGAFVTLLSTGANLTAVTVMEGQQAWLCLLCCNLDRKSTVQYLRLCLTELHSICLRCDIALGHFLWRPS